MTANEGSDDSWALNWAPSGIDFIGDNTFTVNATERAVVTHLNGTALGQAQKKVVAEARDCIRKQTTDKIQAIFENGK